MKRMTKSAAMLVRTAAAGCRRRSGSARPVDARGLQSSSGIVRKNWRNRKVAVAEAISGIDQAAVGVQHVEIGDTS
jgi:hypothetical protein